MRCPRFLARLAALGGASADKVALNVREAAENGNHQPTGAGAGVGPRLGKRAELRLGVHDLLDDGEQVKVMRARRSIRVTVTASPGRGPSTF